MENDKENINEAPIESSVDKLNEELDTINQNLNLLKNNINNLCEITGTNKRANSMREEICKLGWSGIISKYHPDINFEDPASHVLFQMYKFIYEDIKRKKEMN